MLIKKKNTPIGEVQEIGGAFNATKINWATGETKFIGSFNSFKEAKQAVIKA
jgi:hypothetical protein